MRVPLVNAVVADETAEFKTSYAINLETVPVSNNIAEAQYRATSGAVSVGTGPGTDRGAIYWSGTGGTNLLYRVMGTKLVSVDSSSNITTLGDVGGTTDHVGLDFSFSDLIIRSATNLFYYNPTAGLRQVTNVNLGPVIDMLWIDGYTMTTDGTHVVVTELNDPMTVKPLKYGAADEDPDMVTGLMKLRDEAYVLGSNTIQVFRNVGGNGFPFVTQKGATIPVGCVGANAKCLFADTFAFIGSARNEALGVYLAGNGNASRISNRLVDDELAAVADPTQIVLEARTSRGERRLLVHLPTKTLMFLVNASRQLEQSVWCVLQSGYGNPYRLRNACIAYGKTYVGDTQTSSIGTLSDTVSSHFGEAAQWQFDVGPLFNDGKGAILNSVELIGLPGRAPFGVDDTMSLSFTRDGETWSAEHSLPTGRAGQRYGRKQWRPRIRSVSLLGMRFRGVSAGLPGFAACEIEAESLNA